MGLEVMNSPNTELNWKIVKRRRSRKSTSSSPNGTSKVSNSTSPKRVGDFFGSDSDKFGEAVPGQSTSAKSENVPIKKRRHLLQSSSSTHSLCGQDSTSPGTPSSSPFTKDREQLPDPSGSSLQKSTNWEQRGLKCTKIRFEEGLDSIFMCERVEHKYNDEGDFSGIELLAAAASMDDHPGNANGEVLVVGDSSATTSSGASACVAKSELPLKCKEVKNSLSDIIVNGVNAGCSMDLENLATVSCSPHGNLTDGIMRKEDRQHWDLNTPMDDWDKPYNDESITGSILKYTSTDESKNLEVAEMTTGSPNCGSLELSTLEEHSTEPPNSSCSNDASEASDQATEKEANERNTIQVLNCDVPEVTLNQNMNEDAMLDHSASTKLCQPSDLLIPVDNSATSGPAIVTLNEDCSINVNESKRATTSADMQTVTHNIISHDMLISEARSDIQLSDVKDSSTTELAEHVSQHEDNDLSSNGLENITSEDLCKRFSDRAQCDRPTSSIGKIDSAIGVQHDSNFPQGNHIHAVDEVVNKIQAADGSPYEDGELISSFLYSWEDNECVDYESDGRNGDDSDALKVENFSEGSYATEGRSGGSKGEPIKHSFRRRVANDESSYNDIMVKASNAGSGTTDEYPMKMNLKVNDISRSRHFTDKRGKFQAQIEGQSSLDAANRKDTCFTQQCRSRGGRSLYYRPERNISPDRPPIRYRPSTYYERDEVNNWISWDSRRRHTEGFSCTQPRSITGESGKIGAGLDFHEPREGARYLPKGVDGRLMRSPTRRDDYFGMSRRMPVKRGGSNYRSRGHYSQYAGRDLREDFEPFTDDTCLPVRFPPTSGRSAHISLPHRRSRSRSRTNSPRQWHQERILSTRRHSRSPDLRPQQRVRAVFPRSSFVDDCADDYPSPPRRRIPPSRQNSRWDGDHHTFPNNDSRRRRSPARVSRRAQPPDGVGSSGRLKSDGYFRPNYRPRKFSFTKNGGRDCYDDDGTEFMHQRLHPGSNIRRFRHKVDNDFETASLDE